MFNAISNCNFIKNCILFIGFISISSCSFLEEEFDDITGGENLSYFMQVTINGVEYETNDVSVFGFGNRDGCLPVDYHLDNIGQIDIADYFFDAYLFRYENNEDMEGISSGTGSVAPMFDFFYTPEGANSCNFRMVADLRDKQQEEDYTELLSSSSNTVTSVTQISQSSTEVVYAVEGNFSCSFVNVVGEQININGTYRIPIECLL